MSNRIRLCALTASCIAFLVVSIPLTAAAVPGVRAVVLTELRRLSVPDGGAALAAGYLPIGPLEIAQLDNDPDLPENGRLVLDFCPGGGR